MGEAMEAAMRPYRSVLYVPASNLRALEKAESLAADAIIFDLEDAVAPTAKLEARATLRQALTELNYGRRARIVRINGLGGDWGRDDLAALGDIPIDAILVPKVDAPADLDAVAALAPGRALWAMMETPRGVLNAAAIATHPQLAGMVMGTNDLAKDLGCRARPDRMPLLPSLGHCLLAARAHGRVILDGVCNAFKDEAALEAECTQGRDMGFDGKTLIHPAQIDTANRIFAPDPAEIDLARRQISAFEAALLGGQGVAVVDGRIVENLHIVTARHILAKATAIAALAAK